MLHVDERSSREWMRAGGHMLGTGRASETQLQASCGSGSGMGKIRTRDEHPVSNFREFRINFWGFKILKFFHADLDLGIFLTLDPGWKKFGFGIRDKHPGSATLVTTVPYLLSGSVWDAVCVWQVWGRHSRERQLYQVSWRAAWVHQVGYLHHIPYMTKWWKTKTSESNWRYNFLSVWDGLIGCDPCLWPYFVDLFSSVRD